MSRLTEQVGRRIKELRKRSGYTLEELGTRLGMKGHSVWRLETGRRTPSLELLENLAQIMGVSPAFFFGVDGPARAEWDPEQLDPLLRNLWEELNQRFHDEHPITRDQAVAILQAILDAFRACDSSPSTEVYGGKRY
jgi:transcriptional regulator with XRE-family HTH domain